MKIHRLVDPDSADVQVGVDENQNPISVLFWPNGSVGLEHHCRELDPGEWLVVASRLQFDRGHKVVSHDPVTILPSVGCEDCGLHGFVTQGAWVPAGPIAARFPRLP